MKHSVKLLLWKQANKIGHFPIYLRIIVNSKVRYISTGYAIAKHQWDAKSSLVKPSHPNADLINKDIGAMLSKALADIVDKKIKGQPVNAELIKQSSSSKISGSNYFDFVDKYREEIKNKRQSSTIENYKKHTLKLELYHGSRALHFEEITPDYLAGFENDLLATVGINYTYMVIRTIRTMFNAAIKRSLTTYYPFKVYEMLEYTAPDKDVATMDEVKKFDKFADQATHPADKQTAIYFLLGCLTGLRVSDWFKFDPTKHIRKGEVLLRAKKNKEWVTMPVNDLLQRNLKRIALNPITIYEQDFNNRLKDICKKLGIKKKFTTHSGRHTFAVTMCAEKGISAETCAELMGITVQTCVDNYYRVTPEKIRIETARAWAGL